MKFLGLRVCEHDSNFSYFDGKDVHYFKYERRTRKKHDAFENFESWVEEIKKIWNLEIEDLDEIGIVFDPWHYGLYVGGDNFFPSKKFKYLPYNITRINHHYAHALSCWPVVDNCTKHFIFDGFGDYKISWSFFEDDKLIDVGFYKDEISLGHCTNSIALHLGVKAVDANDLAGKLMGLQAYGEIDKKFLNKIINFSGKELQIATDYGLWEQHIGDSTVADLTKLNWAKTVHFAVGKILIKHFKNYINENDVVSFSGGCAANVIWNTELKNAFKNLIVFPHCSDEGLSLGIIEFFRKKHNLPFFKKNNFPYWQLQE